MADLITFEAALGLGLGRAVLRDVALASAYDGDEITFQVESVKNLCTVVAIYQRSSANQSKTERVLRRFAYQSGEVFVHCAA